MFLKNTGIDSALFGNMIKCYECQYNHFYSNAKAETDRKQIANWYQPKHLLENFEDKFKVTEDEAREKYKAMYEEKWIGFQKCKSCGDDVRKFLVGRNELNEYTRKKKLSKEEYLVQLMENYSIDELKTSEFRDLITALETICSTIYK